MKSDMKVKKLRNPILGVKVVDLLGGHVLGSRLFKRWMNVEERNV